MYKNKVKSFTLSEMLVVMIITAIVVGIAFSVLSLVQKQIRMVEKNFAINTTLSLFEQRLWQDFNTHNNIQSNNNEIIFTTDIDTVAYNFHEDYTLRNTDTIKAKLTINKIYYLGHSVESGGMDAISISAERELPGYIIFANMQYDAAHYMNSDGF